MNQLKTLGQHIVLVNLASVTANGTVSTTPVLNLHGVTYLAVESQLVVGSAGGTLDVYVQTSLDRGLTWIDILNHHFTTSTAKTVSTVVLPPQTAFTANTAPTDGTLTNNTVLNGLFGDRIRVKYVSAGTAYGANTTLRVDAVLKA